MPLAGRRDRVTLNIVELHNVSFDEDEGGAFEVQFKLKSWYEDEDEEELEGHLAEVSGTISYRAAWLHPYREFDKINKEVADAFSVVADILDDWAHSANSAAQSARKLRKAEA